MADVKSGISRVKSTTVEEMKVRVFGDTAVVTLVETEKSQYNGKDTSGRYIETNVFVKRNEGWQEVAAHANRLEQSNP